MAKNLELLFKNQEGKIVRYTLESPKEPVDPVQVEQVMNLIIEKNIFTSTNGELVEKQGARIVERNVESIFIS